LAIKLPCASNNAHVGKPHAVRRKNAGQRMNENARPSVITKGFADALRIAYQNRPKLFTRRIDVTAYTLCCFGGAAGQHACRVADALGMW
jgi:N-methylhydantoinase A/oxoprolinase/acetone carboxylase beta subunit